MKKGLILFAIIIVSSPLTSARGDDWIDGITYRISAQQSQVDINYYQNDLSIMGSNEPGDISLDHLSGKQTYMFPIAIELKENLMSSWSYRSAFLDWTFNAEFNDLPPNASKAELTTRSSTSQYLRQPSDTRTVLLNEFFNSSDKEFTDANSNWALSADVKFSTLMIGYYWGIFYPAYGGSHRWLKFGLGFGAFAAQIEIDYNLCSAYIVADKYDEEGNKETHQSGECSGKKKIDNLEAKGAGAAAILNIVVWERKTKDSIWRVLNFELGQTNLSLDPKIEKETFGLKGRSGYFVPSLNILTGTFLSYTSRF